VEWFDPGGLKITGEMSDLSGISWFGLNQEPYRGDMVESVTDRQRIPSRVHGISDRIATT
jgi:hypothetical protein